MSGGQSGDSESGEAIFEMDPQATIWAVARQLVAGRRTLLELDRSAQAVRASGSDTPAARELLSRVCEAQTDWFEQVLPNQLAAMQVAIEAYDTFGPGHIKVDDPIDAAVWHNKFFVWREQLAGSISDHDGSGGDPPAGTNVT